MRRPSIQLYFGDWRSNANLRRCTEAARGALIDIMGVFHDSDEYGLVRWTLADLIRAAGVSKKSADELVDKGVLKGGDKGCQAYIYTPRHAGKDGEPVTLIKATKSPCWYSSRMVRDEYIRKNKGKGGRFSEDNQPSNLASFPVHDTSPKRPPKGGIGGRQGDGSSTSSSSSSSPPEEDISPKPPFGTEQPEPPPPCTLEEAKALAALGMVRISPGGVEFWWHVRNGAGWRRGGAGNPRIRSWQSDLASSVEWAEEGAKKRRGKGGGGGFSSNDVSL